MVSKIAEWLLKFSNGLQVSAGQNELGDPQFAGFGAEAVISDGMSSLGKNHTEIPETFQSTVDGPHQYQSDTKECTLECRRSRKKLTRVDTPAVVVERHSERVGLTRPHTTPCITGLGRRTVQATDKRSRNIKLRDIVRQGAANVGV